MNRISQIEKLASEQSKSLLDISNFAPEAARLSEVDLDRTPLIFKLVFKTGSPADIPTDGLMDFVCLAGIDKFQIELVEVFSKVKQILRLGGRLCLLVSSDLDSFIYYGMENGFYYIKSEPIDSGWPMHSLIRNSFAGTTVFFFSLSGLEWGTGGESQTFTDHEKKITSIWFLRN